MQNFVNIDLMINENNCINIDSQTFLNKNIKKIFNTKIKFVIINIKQKLLLI